MEKCVFIGYPNGYKGWKLYNPTTQKYLISECAGFDERIFPGLVKYKATSPADLTPPGSPSLVPVPTSVPMLDLEGDSDVEVIAPRIPHPHLPLEAALPERTPTPPALPPIVSTSHYPQFLVEISGNLQVISCVFLVYSKFNTYFICFSGEFLMNF